MTEEAAACCVVRGDKQNGGNIGLLHSSASASAACNHCMCDDKPLMQCTACCVAHYCCKEHQAAHWPRHKAMCARYKRLSQQQQQQHDHSHMFSSIVSLSAALVDLTQAQTTSAPAARPSHADITFMCSARASPAAAAVMSAMSVVMGDGTHAGTCCMLHAIRHTTHVTPAELPAFCEAVYGLYLCVCIACVRTSASPLINATHSPAQAATIFSVCPATPSLSRHPQVTLTARCVTDSHLPCVVSPTLHSRHLTSTGNAVAAAVYPAAAMINHRLHVARHHTSTIMQPAHHHCSNINLSPPHTPAPPAPKAYSRRPHTLPPAAATLRPFRPSSAAACSCVRWPTYQSATRFTTASIANLYTR